MRYKIIFLVFSILTFGNVYPQQYAQTVLSALLGGSGSINTNLDVILGPPDLPVSGPTSAVSLGGGFVIVDMEVNVKNGEGIDLKIYEQGSSYQGSPPLSEVFQVLVNSDSASSRWQYLGTYPGDVVEIDLDTTMIGEFRYLAIFDSAVRNALDGSQSPGADIDAIEAINYDQITSVQAHQNFENLEGFQLFQNFPNPFNPHTNIRYNIDAKSHVRLHVYNGNGQRIRTLVNQVQSEGNYSLTWDGTNESREKVASGPYYYQLVVNGIYKSRQMLLVK